jgi:triphosphatase
VERDREIELKLELVAMDAARLLAHPLLASAALVPPETRRLQSVYFDSRERALMQHGITLRLRRSNARQVQTVKFASRSLVSLTSRGEVEVELVGERPDLAAIPDDALRGDLLAMLGDQVLEPIFETDFERTSVRFADGSAEWRIDIDAGEVRAGFAREPISEVELELLEGPSSRLFEVALALADSVPLWPGTRSKAERGHALRTGERPWAVRATAPALDGAETLLEAIREIAGSCLAQIASNADVAFEGQDPEGVHQMRIGVRRLRALLACLRTVWPSTRLGRMGQQLKWLSGLLGEVRDLDVFTDERLRPLCDRRADDIGLARLLEQADRMREERRVLLREGLRSPRTTRLLLELGHWIVLMQEPATPSDERAPRLDQPARDFADAALERLHAKVEKLARRAVAGTALERHALRIALKKLRYFTEFFAALYDTREVDRTLKRLGRLQSVLGTLNDVEAGGHVVRALVAQAEPELVLDLSRAGGFVEGFWLREEGRALRRLTKRWNRLRKVRPFWQEAE